MPLRFKIGYLECVERLLAANDTADEFARALRAAYPELPDEAAAAALAQALYARPCNRPPQNEGASHTGRPFVNPIRTPPAGAAS